MLFAAQYLIANLLVAGGVAIVFLWLFLLLIAIDPNGGLLPWNSAGVVMFGLVFVFVGSMLSLPGIIWLKHLANRVRPGLRPIATLSRKVGIAVLGVGLAVAVLVFVWGMTASVVRAA